ncbi:hypothetical protein BGX38DRAFT_223585 [Terfezia claveryi]|nr:hypothetical protein BGX38DRAFT_223585 [Terfezia claveryi]
MGTSASRTCQPLTAIPQQQRDLTRRYPTQTTRQTASAAGSSSKKTAGDPMMEDVLNWDEIEKIIEAVEGAQSKNHNAILTDLYPKLDEQNQKLKLFAEGFDHNAKAITEELDSYKAFVSGELDNHKMVIAAELERYRTATIGELGLGRQTNDFNTSALIEEMGQHRRVAVASEGSRKLEREQEREWRRQGDEIAHTERVRQENKDQRIYNQLDILRAEVQEVKISLTQLVTNIISGFNLHTQGNSIPRNFNHSNNTQVQTVQKKSQPPPYAPSRPQWSISRPT